MADDFVGPPDAMAVPRFAGPATFARLPGSTRWTDATSPSSGSRSMPGSSYRPGARFGPSSIVRRPGCCVTTTRRSTSNHSATSRSAMQVTSPATRSASPSRSRRSSPRPRAARHSGQPRCDRRRPHRSPCRCCGPPSNDTGRWHCSIRCTSGHVGHLLRCRLHPRHTLSACVGRRSAAPGPCDARRHQRSPVQSKGSCRGCVVRVRDHHRDGPGGATDPGGRQTHPGACRRRAALRLGRHRRARPGGSPPARARRRREA